MLDKNVSTIIFKNPNLTGLVSAAPVTPKIPAFLVAHISYITAIQSENRSNKQADGKHNNSVLKQTFSPSY